MVLLHPPARVSPETAQELLFQHLEPVAEYEDLPLEEALGRIAFADVRAVMAQPPFDRSPLDGYALRHEDSAGASRRHPRHVRLTQRLCAGADAALPVALGECARIMTGAMLPPGADCVIAQEDTSMGEESVALYAEIRARQNICFAGEDTQPGQMLAERGVPLTFAHVGVLAGQGLTSARVFRRPSVAIMSSGDELCPPGQPLPPGKIYNSNSPLLAARLQALGARPFMAGICRDDPELLHRRIRELLTAHDMLVTTGGVSVGQKDYLPDAAERLGGALLFHGISVKPGSPALGMAWEGKILLALSGNPYAAIATLETLAVPALKKLAGYADYRLVRQRAIARSAFGKASDTRRLVRARLERGEVTIPPSGHSSGVLSSLIDCNCLIDIPAGSPGVAEGDAVDVILLP